MDAMDRLMFLWLSAFISSSVLAFTPQSKDDIFLAKGEKEKAEECSKRYVTFTANNFIFKKMTNHYEKICDCSDIKKINPSFLHLFGDFRQVQTSYLSYSAVACHKNIWLCLNPTKEKDLEEARSADEFCKLIDKKIDQEFKTPFASPELLRISLELTPYFNMAKFKWGEKACEELLPKANLHPHCRSGGGEKVEQIIQNEELH